MQIAKTGNIIISASYLFVSPLLSLFQLTSFFNSWGNLILLCSMKTLFPLKKHKVTILSELT